ncbi:MAG: phospholipase D-like domain-containing protein [Myxococcota bacterium]|nr:phospholipase D-like domain-containing protein [Myxococcota bacterium]
MPDARVPRSLRRAHELFVASNSVRLLINGREAFPEMLAAIHGAKRSVLLEMYWFDSDRVGRTFAAALIEAARRGVKVAVIYDAIGSLGASPEMFDELRAAGAHVLEYNPVAPWRRRFRLARLTRRDHRKILLVDGTLGFTGGVNIANQWAPEEEEGGGGWRDDMIRVEGPVVDGFLRCFAGAWQRQAGELPAFVAEALAVPEPQPIRTEGHRVQVVGEVGIGGRHAMGSNYLVAIYRADRRVWIKNSYFVPDRRVVRALRRAARRGVDVRVIVPGESDVPVTAWASRHVWGRLMRSGVRIYQWTRGILHSKTAVVDGNWSTIGTFNLDHLSLRMNLEVNVTVLDEDFGARMEHSFMSDLGQCVEVEPRGFRFRSLGDRLLELIAYRFRKFL